MYQNVTVKHVRHVKITDGFQLKITIAISSTIQIHSDGFQLKLEDTHISI